MCIYTDARAEIGQEKELIVNGCFMITIGSIENRRPVQTGNVQTSTHADVPHADVPHPKQSPEIKNEVSTVKLKYAWFICIYVY